MIIKQVPMKTINKSSYKDLVNYLTNDQGNVSRVNSINYSNILVDSLKSAIIEVQSTQRKNTRAKTDKTLHLIVSFQDGEKPDSRILSKIEDDICKKLGLNEHQRISVIHDDTDNLHMHIAINKVHPKTFRFIEPFQSFKKLSDVAAECEKKFKLKIDNHINNRIKEESIIDGIEIHKGEESLCSAIRNLKIELQKANNWNEFHDILKKENLGVKIRANGLVFFNDAGVYIKGSTVARDFSKARLEKKLGGFEQKINNEQIDNNCKKNESVKTENQTKSVIKNSAKPYTQEDQKKLWIEFQQVRLDSSKFSREQKKEAFLEYKNNINSAYKRILLERKVIKFLKIPRWMKSLFDFYHRYKLERLKREAKSKLTNRIRSVSMVKQSWLCFLKMKSNNGNDTATNILQTRYIKHTSNSNSNVSDNSDLLFKKTEINSKKFSTLKLKIEKNAENAFVTSKGNRIYKHKSYYIKVTNSEIRVTKISKDIRNNKKEQVQEDLILASEKLNNKLSKEQIKLTELEVLNTNQKRILIEQIKHSKDKERERKKMIAAKRYRENIRDIALGKKKLRENYKGVKR